MIKLLKLLDNCCIDPCLYWRIPSQDASELYEIQWRRDNRPQWRIRRVGGLFWDLTTDENLLQDFQRLSIDPYLFEIKLKNSLIQQVTFADRIVKEAKKVLGSSEVNQAIQEHASFLQQLENAIVNLTHAGKKIDKPKLSLVPQDDSLDSHPFESV